MSDNLSTNRQVVPPPTRSMRIVKANREKGNVAPVTETVDFLTAPQAAPEVTPEVTPNAPAIAPVQAAAPAPAPVPDEPKQPTSVKVTYYVSPQTRDRSRAVFKATRDLEDDASYSDMIQKAIEAECERREMAYNDGELFGGGDRPLPSGKQVR